MPLYRGELTRHNRKCSIKKFVLLSVLWIVLWNEFLSYTLSSVLWPRIFSKQSTDDSEVTLLFVADPQLQGFHDVYLKPQFISTFAIFDADRYLYHGFSRAYKHVQPDAIVFLGDLLDEGSEAADADYQLYVARFQSIFRTEPDVKKIYVWGDNDVGGETYNDEKTDWKVNRFKKAFPTVTLSSYKYLDFVHLDLDWRDRYDEDKEISYRQLRSSFEGEMHILLNHMTVLNTMDVRATELLSANLVVSAHTHEARIINCFSRKMHSSKNHNQVLEKVCNYNMTEITDGRIHELNLTQSNKVLHELMVPTCSYRMGVPNMGYAAAIIDRRTGVMRLTVLWLPPRYTQLYGYIFVAILGTSLILFDFCNRRYRCC